MSPVEPHPECFPVYEEGFIRENGEFVATTATLDGRHDMICPIIHNLPARKYPSFECDKKHLIDAAKATTYLLIEERCNDGTLRKRHGTAFFVTKHHLLTAAHNVVEKPDAKIVDIRSSYAGCKTVDHETNTFVCEVLETLSTGDPTIRTNDIAILTTPGHEAVNYLRVSNRIDDLKPDTVVDVVGYPVELLKEQKESFSGDDLTNLDKSLEDAKILLPSHTLVASRGSVVETNDGLIRYELSTVAGMSGGCVMRDGKVYGLSSSSNRLIVGVHIGQFGDINAAVSFSESKVSQLLKKHVVNVQTMNDGYVKVSGAWTTS